MFYKIFDDKQVKHISDALFNKPLVDGKHTQQLSNAYEIKENKEHPVTSDINDYIQDVFLSKRFVKHIFAPTNFTARIYNQYVTNDFYDYHIDPFKSTLSNSPPMQFNYGFTIGLTDDYEGGEFVLQTESGEIGYKVGKGEAVIFPVIYPHKVVPVTKGCRQNIIGWFESKITYEQSYILKHLEEVLSIHLDLIKSNKDQDLFKDLLTKSILIQSYLVNKWSL